mmetsp:Transcript_15659/g.28092  ORF Transcript_15659/g.28092 Transcript_15659/m.28092 type:complete len:158 (+) Transcript_15659:1520-1993(+)
MRSMKWGKEVFKVQIWDTAGPERFRSLNSGYYRGANGCFLMYDKSNRASFEQVDEWFKQVELHASSPDSPACGAIRACVLLANKSDLASAVSTAEGEEKAAALGIPYFEVSAKTGEGVQNAARFMAKLAYPVAKAGYARRNPPVPARPSSAKQCAVS